MPKRICILGAGNMGTALAVMAAKNAPVTLWSIEPDVVVTIGKKRANPRYLPGVRLPKNIRATGNLAEALRGAALVVLAVPSHIVPSLARAIAPLAGRGQYFLNAAKGVEEKTLRTMAEVLRDALPTFARSRAGTMSGPSIANEFGRGLPCAVTVAAKNKKNAEAIAKFFRTDSFRVITSTDLRGTALGGTLKNIYALALGMVDGLGLGMNAKAALLTAALNEMKILLHTLGARPESAYELSGIGDLIVTGMSAHSRNRRFGEALCVDSDCRLKMRDPAQTIEGVKAVAALAPLARKKKLKTPILFEIEAALFKNKKPATALQKIFTTI